MNSRRIFLRRLLWTAMGAVASSARANFGARPVRAGLATSGRFAFLPLRAVEPLGWLREQLQIQASGLSGHLEEVWKDVGPGSGWLGGKAKAGKPYQDGSQLSTARGSKGIEWRFCFP